MTCALCRRSHDQGVLFGADEPCPRAALRAADVPEEPLPWPDSHPTAWAYEGRDIRVVLVACGERKRPGRHPAWALYTGPAFTDAWGWASRQPDVERFILSARWGLVEPGTYLDSYDQQLPTRRVERERWGAGVAAELHARFMRARSVTLTFLAPAPYTDAVRATLPASWAVVTPLAGLTQGARRSWFRQQRTKMSVS